MATQNNAYGTSKLTIFTASGTWTKDSRTKMVCVIGWGSGQGGGSVQLEYRVLPEVEVVVVQELLFICIIELIFFQVQQQ
jgi:hypothetical protein